MGNSLQRGSRFSATVDNTSATADIVVTSLL
ncbi:hypothetical protein NK6_8922 [Bradyrhizobium diazoefficiens]|uniref:Uncharacterized protein n=1 Tax=Bradyrhizobium diazoefficiens TaxID=1355477 RepID=A0A0E4FYI4_9BRAD|nr:hypothetical protein NK6_8922 [Bradyrhizobium diazoefficiens]